MKKYVALIMLQDDFGVGLEEGESIEDIMADAYLEKESWIHGYEFECPDSMSEETVTLIARGYFWENNWSMDGTISCILRDEEASSEDDTSEEVDTDDAIIIKASVS
tara:strand:+ start:177 stop:497 length:321 start_codon:yes stop_codon:yes gene_type:complete